MSEITFESLVRMVRSNLEKIQVLTGELVEIKGLKIVSKFTSDQIPLVSSAFTEILEEASKALKSLAQVGIGFATDANVAEGELSIKLYALRCTTSPEEEEEEREPEEEEPPE